MIQVLEHAPNIPIFGIGIGCILMRLVQYCCAFADQQLLALTSHTHAYALIVWSEIDSTFGGQSVTVRERERH